MIPGEANSHRDDGCCVTTANDEHRQHALCRSLQTDTNFKIEDAEKFPDELPKPKGPVGAASPTPVPGCRPLIGLSRFYPKPGSPKNKAESGKQHRKTSKPEDPR